MKKKLLITVSFIVLIFIGLRSSSALFFSIKNHSCLTSELLSEKYLLSISQYISGQADKNLSPHVLISQVKKEFPVIKKMVIAFKPLEVQVILESYEPICSINDMVVLTSHNELLPKNIFSPHALEMIPAVSVAHKSINNITNILPDMLHALPSDFNNSYNLDFVNEHCIRLVDKNNACFVIVLAHEQKNYSLLLKRCEVIKNNLSSRGAFDRGIEWIADARFAHYIVAYKV
jgi:hypothetical protein